jgi:hypothetical protein
MLDELKTHLRGAQIVLELVRQEFYGLLMAHYAIRGLMHEAALKADEDPDRMSFIHSLRVATTHDPPCNYSPLGREKLGMNRSSTRFSKSE